MTFLMNEEMLQKLTIAESLRFEPKIDLEIISAYVNKRPSQFSVRPSPILLYRCYFIENEIIITYLTHLLKDEYEAFSDTLRLGAAHNPNIDLFVITDNKVVLQEKINSTILAHLLFRFHHRVSKKYVVEEFSLLGEGPK